MKEFINDDGMRDFLLYEAAQEHKGIAFARMVKMGRAKNFLERISGMKAWENRTGSFVSSPLSRKEVYKLALKIPQNQVDQDIVSCWTWSVF